MALSGTLDTFALPDVLRLLASTAKSGRLRITGDRGSGSVWVVDGDVVATELTSAVTPDPDDVEVVFGLLRLQSGSFTFEADAVAPHAGEAKAMEPVLAAAENMLVEWHAIEEVIPSLDVWVGLRPSLDGPDVMIDRRRWSAVAAIGSGAQVGAVAETLALGELDVCRLTKELVELGLVDLIEEPTFAGSAGYEPTVAAGVGDEFGDGGLRDDAGMPDDVLDAPPPAFVPVEDEPFAEFGDDSELTDAPVAASMVSDEPGAEPHDSPEDLLDELDALDGSPDFSDVAPAVPTEPGLAALATGDDMESPAPATGDDGLFGGGVPVDDGDDLDPAEMARQLANLSPKAAKAVAAAAKATTDAERDAALAAVEAEDDSVNRGLLLKFLGSVDS